MKRPDMGCVYLYGRDSDIWEKPDLVDLIALKPQQSEGLFSCWVADHFLHKYHQTIGKYFRVQHGLLAELKGSLSGLETRCYQFVCQYSPLLAGRSTASGGIDRHEHRLHTADCCHYGPICC